MYRNFLISDHSVGSNVVFAILTFAAGILFLFYGFRLFNPVLAATGFATFSILVLIIFANLKAGESAWFPGSTFLMVSCVFVAGVGGACLCLYIWKAGLVCIGALGGFSLALFFLSWKTNGIIDDAVGRPIFILLLTIAGVSLALKYDKIAVICSTSFCGAVLLAISVDLFARMGLMEAFTLFITNSGNFFVEAQVYGLLGSIIVVSIVGMVVQFKVTGKSKKRFYEIA